MSTCIRNGVRYKRHQDEGDNRVCKACGKVRGVVSSPLLGQLRGLDYPLTYPFSDLGHNSVAESIVKKTKAK